MIRRNLVRRTAAALMSALVVQAGGLPYFVPAAWAADTAPRVLVLPLTGNDAVPEKAPERFRELLVSELKGRDTISVVDLPKGAGKPLASARRPSEPPADALEALEAGQQHLAELEFEAAAESLKKGIEGMTARPESIDFEKLIDAYISLAVAKFREGDEDAAQKALGAVVRIAPDYRLPEGKFPPIFVRELEKARRRAEKAVKGSISVDGPPGATAFIDGKDLGMVPVIQDNLTSGAHYVKVEGTRGELFGQVVDVKSGISKVKAQFAGGSASGSGGPNLSAVGPVIDAAAATKVASACESLGADYAVVGTIYRSGEHQLTIASALYSAKLKGFATAKLFTFDEELLTANVEAFKLADDLSDAMDSFPRPASLPLNLASGASYRVSTIERSRDVEVATTGRRTALIHSNENPKLVPDETEVAANAHEDAKEGVRILERRSVDGDSRNPVSAEGTTEAEARGGPAWWVWALVGVGVAAAAGGTYYGVTEAAKPVTGTVTARW